MADDIKKNCCGDQEHVDIIDPRLVHQLPNGYWMAEGYQGSVQAPDHVKPSIDEHTWIFWNQPIEWEKGKQIVNPPKYLHCLLIQLSM